MRQRNPPWQRASDPIHATRLLAALLTTFACAAPAAAAPLCTSAMFDCRIGDEVWGPNLKILLSNPALRKRFLKNIRNCELTPSTATPFRCDWRRTIKLGVGYHTGGSSGASGGASNDTGAAAPAPRRDVAGRRGTTPAPTRVQVAAVKTPDRGPYSEEIAAAAERYKIPPDLVRAVIQVESAFNPTALSVKGAVGLMQLLPETGKAMGATDLRNPADNIAAGTRFLRLLANRFGGDLVKVLSAYHAGSTRVLRREATPFAATDSYVRKVLGVYYALRDG
ncbi:MAG: lytic transglycosylase domain-containing protein [Deltaproteobacteria bacterium]|nr:lytic transglycosylase domain-containing protein [Deltaproteobacteria bacterium]